MTFIEFVFVCCVEFLEWLGELTGLGYIGINVWIFCVIVPIVFFLMAGYIIYLRHQLKKVRHA